MADPFIGEIRLLSFGFAPRYWAPCEGQLLAISQNQALFSLIGTTYGGDGRVTFGLPDLRGRVPLSAGSGPGLSPYVLGERVGVEQQSLALNQVPTHTHSLMAATDAAGVNVPAGNLFANSSSNPYAKSPPAGSVVQLAQGSVTPQGGGAPHENRQPLLAMYFAIALSGIYPPRP